MSHQSLSLFLAVCVSVCVQLIFSFVLLQVVESEFSLLILCFMLCVILTVGEKKTNFM